MQVKVQKRDLQKCLSRIQGVIDRKSTFAMLATCHIKATDQTLILTATDLELAIRTKCEAQVKEGGEIAVSAKHLYDIARELPQETVTLKVQNNTMLEITSGKATFRIVCMNPQEFPRVPDFNNVVYDTIPAKVLLGMITKTLISVSHDETRQYLNGIYVEPIDREGNRTMRMVSTDGYRLSLVENKDLAIMRNFESGIIFPKKGMVELKKLMEETEGEVGIALQGNEVIVLAEDAILHMRLIEGKYPNYEKFIPKANRKQAIVRRAEFLNSLKRVSLLSYEKLRGVKLTLTENELMVSSVNSEIGEAKEDFPVNYSGPAVEIGFNARYLIEALSIHEDEEIKLELDDKLSPAVIRGLNHNDQLCVIMPIRFNQDT